METFSALLAICAGNSPVPSEFPTRRPVTRSFDIFFDLRLNKLLSKQRVAGVWDAIAPIMTPLYWTGNTNNHWLTAWWISSVTSGRQLMLMLQWYPGYESFILSILMVIDDNHKVHSICRRRSIDYIFVIVLNGYLWQRCMDVYLSHSLYHDVTCKYHLNNVRDQSREGVYLFKDTIQRYKYFIASRTNILHRENYRQ